MTIVLQIIKLFGGLGMFLFGMNTMSSGLERAAGLGLRDHAREVAWHQADAREMTWPIWRSTTGRCPTSMR